MSGFKAPPPFPQTYYAVQCPAAAVVGWLCLWAPEKGRPVGPLASCHPPPLSAGSPPTQATGYRTKVAITEQFQAKSNSKFL